MMGQAGKGKPNFCEQKQQKNLGLISAPQTQISKVFAPLFSKSGRFPVQRIMR
jgi:hypothetical protein